MRLLIALAVSLAGCVTVVVPSADGAAHGDPAEVGRRALLVGQRESARRLLDARQVNLEALASDAVRIGSDAQAWSLKPRAFGGGDGSFNGVSLLNLGYPVEADGRYHTVDGSFSIEQEGAVVLIRGESARFELGVTVHVAGRRPEEISLTVRSTP